MLARKVVRNERLGLNLGPGEGSAETVGAVGSMLWLGFGVGIVSVIQTVSLIRGSTGEGVEASLVHLEAKHVEQFDVLWKPLLLEVEASEF